MSRYTEKERGRGRESKHAYSMCGRGVFAFLFAGVREGMEVERREGGRDIRDLLSSSNTKRLCPNPVSHWQGQI